MTLTDRTAARETLGERDARGDEEADTDQEGEGEVRVELLKCAEGDERSTEGVGVLVAAIGPLGVGCAAVADGAAPLGDELKLAPAWEGEALRLPPKAEYVGAPKDAVGEAEPNCALAVGAPADALGELVSSCALEEGGPAVDEGVAEKASPLGVGGEVAVLPTEGAGRMLSLIMVLRLGAGDRETEGE